MSEDDALEDAQDVETIRQRLAEGGDTVPWEDIKAEMDAEVRYTDKVARALNAVNEEHAANLRRLADDESKAAE